MGLFGKKKVKTKAPPAQASSYTPPAPADVVSSSTEVEASMASMGDDAVMVPSAGRNDSKKASLLPDEEMATSGASDVTENQSVVSKASTFVLSALSKTKSVFVTDGSADGEYVEQETKPVKEEVMDRVTACSAGFLAFWLGLSKAGQVALVAGAAIGAVTISSLVAAGGRSPAFPSHINVAFVGNSYFYANDLPRFVENIAGGHVTQDSVLHNSASLLQVIMTGNGMWNKWATTNAMMNGVKFNTNQGTTKYLYDMGSCSVPELLTGHDSMISPNNQLGSFVNDGQNPCFQQDAYREYHESTGLDHGWDFVVITDQSKAMASDASRKEALMAFNYTFGPILKENHISPIIVQPHAYTSSGASSAALADLTSFTALIMEGAEIYRKYLNKRIGLFNHAHVAPVGNAYLAVYEESPTDLWPKLFLDDGVHPSAYGTFLYGCVIYATMTGYMPKYNRVVIDDMENSELFANARRLQASYSTSGFPTKDEAAVLYKIAKKVAIRGKKPSSLKGYKIEEDAADYLTSSSNNVYQGNYAGGQAYEYQEYNANYGNNYQVNNDYGNYEQNNNDNANGNYNGGYNGGNANGNYNGGYNGGYNDYGNNYQVNNDYGNNYQVNNDYGNNQEDNNNNYQANNDYGNNQQNNNDNDNNNNNDDKQYYEAAQEYYQNRNQYGNNNYNNNNNAQQQYGGGNQNKIQYYYQQLTDDGN